jgi:hypothetical protein
MIETWMHWWRFNWILCLLFVSARSQANRETLLMATSPLDVRVVIMAIDKASAVLDKITAKMVKLAITGEEFKAEPRAEPFSEVARRYALSTYSMHRPLVNAGVSHEQNCD